MFFPKRCIIIFWAFILIFSSPVLANLANQSKDSYYEIGLKKLKTGSWEIALKVWLQGILHKQEQNEVDPRLSFAFIRVATEHKAQKYYSSANSAYFWGLNKKYFKTYFELYKQEAERLFPIIGKKTEQKLKNKLRKRDPTAINIIRNFWDTQDPIVTTPNNERLLGHWERIAYARQQFTKSESTVYGTDDRGHIYVRYGPAQVSYNGTFGFNTSLARLKANELIDLVGKGPAGSLSDDSSSAVIAASNFAVAKT